jgi:DNA-binding transcriptional regulator YhcF (GntR family)
MTAEPWITVDADRPVPPYVQVRDQIEELIRAGELAADARLPTVRQLAADLGLAAGTVARAYQELEASGLVHTRRGGGTRVAPQPGATQRRRAALVRRRAEEYLDHVRRLGVSADEAVAAVEAAARGAPSPAAAATPDSS